MNISKLAYSLVCLIILTSLSSIHSQAPLSDSISLRQDAIRFFLDCNRCDINYIRREIPYVNYVRDVKEAQVYALMTRQEAGNGGREYTFSFEGLQDFKGMNDTLKFTSMPDDTEDQVREGQLQMLKLGLLRYVARTPLYHEIDISHSGNLEDEDVSDRWNN